MSSAILVNSTRHPFAGVGHALDGIWLGLTRRLFSGYRPERHYMRGPGPAWRAKHGTLHGTLHGPFSVA